MSLTLSGSSALWCVKLGDALEIRNGITFDFYPGLPHIHFCLKVGTFVLLNILAMVLHAGQTIGSLVS